MKQNLPKWPPLAATCKGFKSDLALIFSTSMSHKPSKKLNTSRRPISAAMYKMVSPASFCIDMTSETPSAPLFFSCCLSPSRSPHRTALKMAWWVTKHIAFEFESIPSFSCATQDSTFTSLQPWLCCVVYNCTQCLICCVVFISFIISCVCVLVPNQKR